MNQALRYRAAFRRLAAKHKSGKKIRVGFGVIADSIFPLSRVFELMLHDIFFDPFIIAIPDAHRGREHAVECYGRTCSSLREMFPDAKILESFDPASDTITDYSDLCDLYAPANPYEVMNPPAYKSVRFARKNIPIFYSNYGTGISNTNLEGLSVLNYWRIYATTKIEYDACKKNGNGWLSGMSRMDRMADIKVLPRTRKRIILAPHHTIFKNFNFVTLSQFLRYADFFLDVPKNFPEIDFCFRPHPLLIHNLQSELAWGKEKTTDWLDRMAAMNNVEIQRCGDFLPAFVSSDALIHDCGSFIADYMFTGKPCCYMFPEGPLDLTQYNKFAIECLAAHYQAHNKDHILEFINKTVVQGIDPLAGQRRQMFESMKCNYPHNSETIVQNIKDEILKHSLV